MTGKYIKVKCEKCGHVNEKIKIEETIRVLGGQPTTHSTPVEVRRNCVKCKKPLKGEMVF